MTMKYKQSQLISESPLPSLVFLKLEENQMIVWCVGPYSTILVPSIATQGLRLSEILLGFQQEVISHAPHKFNFLFIT